MKPLADGTIPPHQPNCLGCGTDNPASMGLALRVDGDRIRGRVTFDARHEGAPGFAHGGAVATVLDDALGTVLVLVRKPAVTASLSVNYRAPAFLGRELEVDAWAVEVTGRKVQLAGRVRDGDVLVAEAEALFLEVDLEHFRRSGRPLPELWQSWGDRDAGAA